MRLRPHPFLTPGLLIFLFCSVLFCFSNKNKHIGVFVPPLLVVVAQLVTWRLTAIYNDATFESSLFLFSLLPPPPSPLAVAVDVPPQSVNKHQNKIAAGGRLLSTIACFSVFHKMKDNKLAVKSSRLQLCNNNNNNVEIKSHFKIEKDLN